ncbi:hypothetical protein HYE67_009824 [Fusarium culmorum]|uniref:Uncharacterized protein n=1 Tax=Fusarium culmorum TaxID=5516 RepID=A0A2T4H9U7_FUSCU|nr:hypothetical protein FCULG_00004764 [Fusarium culmorum]QPC67593.1 hypothetical protein HYE67_009824 [Fusarium culmorum]
MLLAGGANAGLGIVGMTRVEVRENKVSLKGNILEWTTNMMCQPASLAKHTLDLPDPPDSDGGERRLPTRLKWLDYC